MTSCAAGGCEAAEDAAHPHQGPALPAAELVLARSAAENFPVAARLLPQGPRRHLFAVYGYARLVDYAGDEALGDRSALLDLIAADVERIYHGTPRIPLIRTLATTVRECAIPPAPLHRLLEANRRDQRVRRYATFDDLLEYCAYSANPVGELVLHVFGRARPAEITLSDRICTALQILEHCQDVVEDLQADRVYLPVEDLRRFGCEESDLAARTASQPVRQVVRLQVDRARQLMDEGQALIGRLPLLGRVAVSGYLAGGRATAVAIAAADYDVLAVNARPRPHRVLASWVRLAATRGAW